MRRENDKADNFEPGEQYSGDGPICPYCGHIHYPDEAFFYDEDLDEMDCYSCDKKFRVSLHISHRWTTDYAAATEEDLKT